MKYILAFLCVHFSVILFADLSYARKDTGDYWKSIMKDQTMPKTIKDLFHQDVSSVQDSSSFASNFDNRPNAIIYKGSDETERFAKNFDNSPNAIIYKGSDEMEEHLTRNFDNRPNVIIYKGLDETDRFSKNFDNSPNVIIYKDSDETDRFAKSFDNSPNVIIYHTLKNPREEKFEAKHEGKDVIKQVSSG